MVGLGTGVEKEHTRVDFGTCVFSTVGFARHGAWHGMEPGASTHGNKARHELSLVLWSFLATKRLGAVPADRVSRTWAR